MGPHALPRQYELSWKAELLRLTDGIPYPPHGVSDSGSNCSLEPLVLTFAAAVARRVGQDVAAARFAERCAAAVQVAGPPEPGPWPNWSGAIRGASSRPRLAH